MPTAASCRTLDEETGTLVAYSVNEEPRFLPLHPISLHILLAREKRVGLVIRHAPKSTVCTLLWDRRTDQFTLGQWMRARIDIGSCGLSPDGKHFIYSAYRGYGRTGPPHWTAVSRTPYLKALAWYPWRFAGGWFLNPRDYCAPGPHDPGELESPGEVRRVDAVPPESLYAARFADAGWTVIDRRTFIRAAGSGWDLQHNAGAGYRLLRAGLSVDTEGWDWADVDRSRFAWTRAGCLWAGVMRKNGLHEVSMLHDFNAMEFERREAPYTGGQPVSAEVPSAPRRALPQRPRQPVQKKPDRSPVRFEPGEFDEE